MTIKKWEKSERKGENRVWCGRWRNEAPAWTLSLHSSSIPSWNDDLSILNLLNSQVRTRFVSTSTRTSLLHRQEQATNDGSRIQLRLSFQGRLDWRFRNWEIQSSLEIHKKRILTRIQIHNRRRIRYEKHRSRFKDRKGSDLGHWWVRSQSGPVSLFCLGPSSWKSDLDPDIIKDQQEEIVPRRYQVDKGGWKLESQSFIPSFFYVIRPSLCSYW